MKGKRDPRFQQVYSPPFIFVRKSFQDANNDTSQPFSAHPSSRKGLFGVQSTIFPHCFLHIPSFSEGLWRSSTTINPRRFHHIPSSRKGLFGVSTTINPYRFLHIPSFGGAWGGTPPLRTRGNFSPPLS